jgi:hypothetical protein
MYTLQPMESLTILALTTLVSAFVGSYLAGYLRRKGENLATHEDIDKLVDQVAAVTTTTKEIEAKITSDVWDRQKRWELRREVLFEATRRVADIDDALLSLDTIIQVEHKNQKRDDDPTWLQTKSERLERWRRADTAFDETKLFVAIVCGRQTKEAFDDLGIFAGKVVAGLNKKDTEIYQKSQPELTKKLFSVRAAIRKELGIDNSV